MKKIKMFAVSAAMVFVLCSCAKEITPVGGEPSETTLPETTAATVQTEPPLPEDVTVHVTAAGDNLIHSSIYNQAHTRSEDGTYDFEYAYEHIRPLICGDVNILNQETPICNDIYEPSTYPCFNSPTQLGDEMLSLGFNAFNHANNHILDQGVSGANATLDYWSDKDAAVCGVYRDTADMSNIRTMDVNGVRFSFLGFTEHTNGLRIPEGSDLRVVYTSELDVIEQQISAARQFSDVVVVSVHWGVENSHIVTDAQRGLGQKMADWGADIIVGTHPHVIQSMEEITSVDGRNVLVAYSLGNFISAQSVNNRMIGGVLDFDVTKSYKTDSITLSNIKFIPVVTHYDYGFSNVRVYPFSEYTAELAGVHGVNAYSPLSYDFIVKTLRDNIDEKYLVLELQENYSDAA